MKPLKLELQAFGPYKDYECIDFTRFEKDKTFLICGETGSGKTMILDALTYALYGSQRGNSDKSDRTNFEELRCNQAKFGTDTFVKLTFENNGIVYSFERFLECKRTKLSQRQNVFRIADDGSREVVFENCRESDINTFAQEIIGLNCEQFRQIIILPQGKFEKFLTADSDSKEKILSSIFNTQRWESIAKIYYDNAKSEYDKIKAIKDVIRQRLAEYGYDSADDFCQLVKEKSAELEQMELAYKNADYDKHLESLEKQENTARKFTELDSVNAQLEILGNSSQIIKDKEQRLLFAQKAQAVTQFINDYRNAVTQKDQRDKQLSEICNSQLPIAEKSVNATQNKLSEHKQQEKLIDKKKSEITIFESKRELYLNISTLEKNTKEAKKIFENASQKAKAQQVIFENKKSEFAILTEQENSLSQLYREKQRLYLNGIYGEIGEHLLEGQPCPVCGNTHHIKKAQRLEGAPTKEELERLDEQCQKHHKSWAEAESAMSAEKETLDKLLSQVSETQKAYEIELERLTASKKNLIDGIENITQLETKIAEIKKAVDDYYIELEALSNAQKQACDKLTSLKSSLENATAECEKAKTAVDLSADNLKKSLADNGFETSKQAQSFVLTHTEQAQLQKELSDYKARLKHCTEQIEALKSELEGAERVALSDVKAKIRSITDSKLEYASAHSRLDELVKRLAKTKAELDELERVYDDNIRQVTEDFEFARELNGSNDKIGLQTYVLAVMFNRVISEANEMLKSVHGGRYHLFRTDERSGSAHSRGLNLKVYDSYSPDENGRAVSGLSGGEKFLVSLSLAIGMSTVAQKSGIRIDAMFIDEGFGTLDDGSIDDALNVLKGVQKANSLVGIISHVQVLRDNITQKIEVKKSSDGSKIITDF